VQQARAELENAQHAPERARDGRNGPGWRRPRGISTASFVRTAATSCHSRTARSSHAEP